MTDERPTELVSRKLLVESFLDTGYMYESLQVNSEPGPVFSATFPSAETLVASHGSGCRLESSLSRVVVVWESRSRRAIVDWKAASGRLTWYEVRIMMGTCQKSEETWRV